MPKYAVKADEGQKYVTIHRHPCGLIRKEVDWFGTWKHFDGLKKAEAFARQWEGKGHPIKYCRFCMSRK